MKKIFSFACIAAASMLAVSCGGNKAATEDSTVTDSVICDSVDTICAGGQETIESVAVVEETVEEVVAPAKTEKKTNSVKPAAKDTKTDAPAAEVKQPTKEEVKEAITEDAAKSATSKAKDKFKKLKNQQD